MTSPLENIITSLIALNRQNRDTFGARFRPAMPIYTYAAEFCTVVVDVGRGTGKTTAIASLARPGDLVVVPNFRDAERFNNNVLEGPWVGGIKAIAPIQIESVFMNSYKTIWVDEPRFLWERTKPFDFFAHLARTGDETFVLVGSPAWFA